VEEIPLRRVRNAGDLAVAGYIRGKTAVRRTGAGAAANAGDAVVRTAVRVVRVEGEGHEETAESGATTRGGGAL
jgi:hypothetical protein